MDAKFLIKTWAGPDNSRLMRNQTSMRLSVHVAAKISALGEMFPQRTKTQLINDLLSKALDELEAGLEETHPWEESEEGLEWLPTQKTKYQALVKKYLTEIEASEGVASSEANEGRRKQIRR